MPSWRADLVAAFQLLTRLPVGWIATPGGPGGTTPDLRRMVWAFPIVGIAVGLAGGIVWWIADGLGAPATIAAILALTATVLVTGAMHEDGLADTADGFGGGATRERKLEIMRDSRTGSYGAIALVLSVALRIAALAHLAEAANPLLALVAAGALGRAVIAGLMRALPPARSDGLAAQGARPEPRAVAGGLAIAGLVALLLLPLGAALAAILAAALAWAVIAWLARRQIGGHTGDVLGAGEQVAECLVLAALAAAV